MKSSILSSVLAAIALLSAEPTEGAKSPCSGMFGRKGTVNLCSSHFPDKSSDKIWFVMFYAPWCGHCKNMVPDWERLGKHYKDQSDGGIKIGGIDCDEQQNKGICGQHGVQGFPTIKAIAGGKAKNYQFGRDFESFKQWLDEYKKKRGSKGGSAKCEKGLFKSAIKHSVVALCEKHYPGETAKSPWVISFYKKGSFADMEEINRFALELGNEPADKAKSRKTVKKQSERLETIKEKYNLAAEAVDRKMKTKDSMAKYGAVCCDCNEESQKFCEAKGIAAEKPVHLVFTPKRGSKNPMGEHKYDGKQEDDGKVNIDDWVRFAMEKLDFVKAGAAEKKEEL